MRSAHQWRGKTYYPVHVPTCKGCALAGPENGGSGSEDCKNRPVEMENCGSMNDPEAIIWQTGEEAALKYMTQRLKE